MGNVDGVGVPAIVRPPHPGRMTFAANLKTARKEAGLSQEALAHAAGLDRSFYVEVEQGRRSVTIDRILEICEALKISAAQLFHDL